MAPPSRRSSRHWKGSRAGDLDDGCSGRGRGYTPGSGADEQRGCTPPSVCVRTQSPKHGIDTPCEENSNTTPAPRLGIGGPCRRADERGAGGRDRHHTSPCKTQWPKHPTASLNAQGTDADCAVQHPAADTRCVNAPSARTFPNTKTRFRPLNICTLSPPPAGVRHNGEPPASAGAAESKKTPTQASFFVEQFFIRCAAADTARLSSAISVGWHGIDGLKESPRGYSPRARRRRCT